MARKGKARDCDAIRKTLKDKLSVCAIDEYAGLDDDELEELLKQSREYAARWQHDCNKTRNAKGSGAATAMLQMLDARLDTIEDRKLAKEHNRTAGQLKSLTITYQEPEARILARVEGAEDDGEDQEA